MLETLIIATDPTFGGDIIENAAGGSFLISESFNELWQQTLDGGLYISMCQLGQIFAVGTLVFFMVEMAKNWMNGDDALALSSIIWPIIVISLLFNNGTMLKNGTLAVRSYINEINNDVLEYTAAEANLKDAFSRVVNNIALKQQVATALQDCRSLPGGTDEATRCLEQAQAEIQSVSDQLSQGTPSSDSNWEFKILETLEQTKNSLEDIGDLGGQIKDSISGALGSLVTGFATVILLGLCNAYQWGVEFSMLLTALLGPLAVGASLLPYGAKQIFVWLKGFFTLGMAKLSFNIIIGLCGQLVSNAEQNQPMIFLLFIGIISPLLATALAAGGGLAVFGATSQAATAVVGASGQLFGATSGSVKNYMNTRGVQKASAASSTRDLETIAAIKGSKQ